MYGRRLGEQLYDTIYEIFAENLSCLRAAFEW